MTLAYEVVDVFTDQAFAGNPLAVVLDADELSTEQMQTLAREFNLSETAFPLAAPDGATYGLRIFTPVSELPFAGHPSVGAAWVLRRLGRIDDGPNIQACGAGLLPVLVAQDAVTLSGGTPSVGEPLDPAPFLAAVGLSADDLAGSPVRFCGTGIDFAYLLVKPDAVARARPSLSAVAALGGTGTAVLSWDGARASCRVFACSVGILEDPATGSAALGLGVMLAASGLLEDGVHPYVVEQGVQMGRPSTLVCTVEVVDGEAAGTQVTGTVVPIARGEIRVP